MCYPGRIGLADRFSSDTSANLSLAVSNLLSFVSKFSNTLPIDKLNFKFSGRLSLKSVCNSSSASSCSLINVLFSLVRELFNVEINGISICKTFNKENVLTINCTRLLWYRYSKHRLYNLCLICHGTTTSTLEVTRLMKAIPQQINSLIPGFRHQMSQPTP